MFNKREGNLKMKILLITLPLLCLMACKEPKLDEINKPAPAEAPAVKPETAKKPEVKKPESKAAETKKEELKPAAPTK